MNYDISKLHIKRRELPQWLAIYVLVIPFCLSFLMDFLNFPSFIKYTVDIAWLILLMFLFVGKVIILKRNITALLVIAGGWFLYVSLVYLFNYQSIFYYLWGIRNNFRFYIAFAAFATFLDYDDIFSSLKFIDLLFWINVPVSLFQFFVLGYRQDYLGGIFGVERGCNAFSTILFLVVVAKSLLMYFEGSENTIVCFLKSGFSLTIAAMAELKFYFILFILLMIISILMTKFSWRKLLALFAVAVLMMFAGSILTVVFGAHEKLTFERIVELVTSDNYATAEDLGRFTALPKISKNILTEWHSKVFGMGIGNCDTSAFAICNTPFYKTHENMHYSWFSSAFIFLETGYLGLTVNLSFYVAVLLLTIKKLKLQHGNKLFCQIGLIFSIICLILTFYNSALRKEVGYIAYFALALPFVSESSVKNNRNGLDVNE